MGKINIIVGNVTCRIEASRAVLKEFDDALAVEVAGAFFAKQNRPGWDGKFHPVDMIRGTFPTGLLARVRGLFPLTQTIDQRKPPGRTPLQRDALRGVTLRDYQIRAIESVFSTGSGIIALGTGGGKTEVGIAIALHIHGKCVWIVHRKDLLHQTADRIHDRTGIRPALVGDGNWDDITPKTPFVVAMPQTIDREPEEFLDRVKNTETLILDECHRTSGAAAWYKIAMKIPAYHRVGLTGTPDTGDDAKNLRLEAATGPILFRMKTSELAESGFAVPCRVVYHKIPKRYGAEAEEVNSSRDWARIRRFHIEEHPARNNIILRLTSKCARAGQKVLIICDTLRHMRKISEALAGTDIRTKDLHGKHASKIRNTAKRALQRGALEVLITTPIFDEGVDIPELDVLILAAGGKSSVRLLQRIGRALRKSEGKSEAVVHDFVDTGSRYTMKHWAERYRACQQEGFQIQEQES